MFSEETISAVKDVMRVEEVISDFVKLTKSGTNLTGLCPFHDEKTPSFVVSPAKQMYKCFGCGKSGDAIAFLTDKERKSYPESIAWLARKYKIQLTEENQKVFKLPTWRNKTELSSPIVKYFETRKISQKTLVEAKITDGKEFMPQLAKEVLTVHFNYFKDDILINVKYRGPEKSFKLFSGAELIYYNLNCVKGAEEVFIVEGEIDALSLIEAGYKNVISVPNGASKDRNNLSYVDNSIELFADVKKIHLALDNDLNGRNLREQLSDRYGKERCDYIEFKGFKDANECLVKEGIQGIINGCANPINFPLEGVFTISDIEDEIDDMYLNGLDKGVSTLIPGFDLNIVKGYFTTVTGIPSHGKSELVDYIVINLIRFHNQKWAFYSPENKPTQLHFSKMARRIIGKHWEGKNKITKDEKDAVKKFLEKKIWFVKPEKNFTLTSILSQIKDLQIRYGLDGFVIDAWNKLEHKDDSTESVGKALDELANFCELNNLHCILVAHPTKMKKDSAGKYEVPTMYNINGSSNFYNKTDNGIAVYRDFHKQVTTVYRQKIKFDHWGKEGHSEYKYDYSSKRYYQEGDFDGKNWITGEWNKKDKEVDKLAFESIEEDAPF